MAGARDRRQASQLGLRCIRALVAATAVVAANAAWPVHGARASTPFQVTLPVNSGQLSDAKLGAALDMARDAGVTQIQTPAAWWWVAREGERAYDWSGTDRLLAAAEARGLRVVMQVTGTPDWVHPDLGSIPHADRIWYPPDRNATELGHWSDFVRDLMTRYRGRVAHYEIWNETNWHDFWKPWPDPEGYARLLRAAYYTGREADPTASIVFGGISQNDIGYLREFYDRAESLWPTESAREDFFFDVLGVHPYSRERGPRVLEPRYIRPGCCWGDVDENFLGFRQLKALMDAREETDKPLYFGEYGFSTTRTWMEAVPDEVRAQYLFDAYALAKAEGYVTGMSWYAFVPNTATPPEWAIVDADLNPSLTFEALRGVSTGQSPDGNIPRSEAPTPTPRYSSEASAPAAASSPTSPPADGTTPPPSTPEFTRTIGLAYSDRRDRFVGRLASQSPVCISDQGVSVFAQKKGEDPKVGPNTTNSAGEYSVKERKAEGKFYVSVKQTRTSAGICLAAKSKTIEVG